MSRYGESIPWIPLLFVLVLAVACEGVSTDPAVRSPDSAPALAKGGIPGPPDSDSGDGGSDDALPDPVVTAAEPDSASRDTTLDVTIVGDNFVDGSVVEFLLDEEPADGITTNSTVFVNKKKLIANITISARAEEDSYDIQVTTPPPGRKGVGLELFAVTASTITTFSDRDGDRIVSDGGGPYSDGDCGILSDFNLTDARLDPDANYAGWMKRFCPDGTRTLTFLWTNPADEGAPKPDRTAAIFMNIDAVETETGTDVLHSGQFNVCNRLVFNPDDPWVPGNGSNRLLVSYDDKGTPANPFDDTWTVKTRPHPNDKGYCVGDGRLWHMPFELTIRRR